MKRKSRSNEEKKAKLPNPLAKGSKPEPRKFDKSFLDKLMERDPVEALSSLNSLFLNKDRRKILDIPFIVEQLSAKNGKVRSAGAKSLAEAAKKGVDISPAFPALIKALSDPDPEVKFQVVGAFFQASSHDPDLSEKDLDISDAIPELLKLLSNPQERIRSTVIAVLSNEDYRLLVFDGIMERIHSEWFQKEMEKNSPIYVRMTDAFGRLLDLFKYDETLMADIAKKICERYEKKE